MRFALALVTGLILLTLPAWATAQSARGDTVLSWDDGIPDYWQGAPTYVTRIAVRFDAPDWATHVSEVQVYVRGGEDGSPAYLAVRVWRHPFNATNCPGDPVCEPVLVEVSGAEGRWVLVPLPVPVSIVPPLQFPEGVFYAGFEWLSSGAPEVGMDDTEPWDGETCFSHHPEGWWPWGADALIRAVVTDEYPSPVEAMSWARIKATVR